MDEHGGASNTKVICKSFKNDDRGVCESTARGFLKIITNKNDDVAGATIVSPVVGEMTSEIVIVLHFKSLALIRVDKVYSCSIFFEFDVCSNYVCMQ